MPGQSRKAALHVELAELYLRARRVMEESRTLAADREFVNWWYGMQPHPESRRENILGD
jgi:hypothetical protein